MNLIRRINQEITKLKKDGEIPSIVWLGREERREFEGLVKDLTDSKCVKETSNNIKNDNGAEICGLPIQWIASDRWLTISSFNN